MKWAWRDLVRQESPEHEYADPARHDLAAPCLYTHWDLCAIRQCGVLFAYMEADNPSGIGLSLEVGYALALGKLVVLVDEKHDPRMAIVREAAGVVFDRLDDGIAFLQALEKIP